MTFDKEKYIPLLKNLLTEERFCHSIGVMDSARELAEHYGTDPEKAAMAGLLHDITKNMSDTYQIEALRMYGKLSDPGLIYAKGVWHAITGAYYVKNELGIDDSEIFNMIYWHTSGHADMTLPEKIIYIADFIEPNRKYSNVKELRQLAFQNIDKAALAGAQWCIERNVMKGKYIYASTTDFYNDLVKESRI